MDTPHHTEESLVIKKYANRRLYDTSTSKYITLEDVAQMVKHNVDFVVRDAKTNEDLTRSILTQVIFEQESKGYNMLPIGFLRQLICFYDDSLRNVLPHYLEASISMFSRNQDQMRSYMSNQMDTFSPMKNFEAIARQNMDIFENAMKMFTEFNRSLMPGSNRDKE